MDGFGWIGTIIIGGLAGWIASIILKIPTNIFINIILGIVGAVVFRVMQDVLSAWTPQYWQFWLGLVLVVIVLVGHERLAAPIHRLRDAWARRGGASAADRA